MKVKEKEKRLPKLPEHLAQKLSNIADAADATRSYFEGQKAFEEAFKKYDLGIKYLYQLGILYDHYAIFNLSDIKDKKEAEKIKKEYLEKAQQIYHLLLSKYPGNVFGYRGIARIAQERGDHKKAAESAVKAYKAMMALPKSQRGVLGVGSFYESMKDEKAARRWYVREVKDLGEENFGAVANLMSYYARRSEINKAYPWALKTKKLLAKFLKVKKGVSLLSAVKGNMTLEFVLKNSDAIISQFEKGAGA